MSEDVRRFREEAEKMMATWTPERFAEEIVDARSNEARFIYQAYLGEHASEEFKERVGGILDSRKY
jgi:hypothetical protein